MRIKKPLPARAQMTLFLSFLVLFGCYLMLTGGCPAAEAVHDLAEHTPTLISALKVAGAIINYLLLLIFGYFWYRLGKVEERQSILREETLPDEYVKVDAMKEFKDEVKGSVNRLGDALHEFMESCRKGECAIARGKNDHGS